MELSYFDASQVDPNLRFDPVPAGDYEVMITESEEQMTSRCDGSFLKLTLEIQSGEHQGRKIFDRLNLNNPNQKTVTIAQQQLSQIYHALGITHVKDSEELHFKPLIAKVKVRPPRVGQDGNKYDASNEIRGYKQAGMASQQAPQGRPMAPYHSTPHATTNRTSQPAAQQPQRPARAAPPWAAQGG